MLKMIKYVSIVMALGLATLVIPRTGLAVEESAAFEQAARHVSIVYDDSGSMYYDPGTRKPLMRWVQANYMLQTFCALLGERDELFVTYLSASDAIPADIAQGDRADALAAIRGWQGFIGQTPFAAVESAYAVLMGLDRPEEDEYWLVVMTDGDFTNFEGDLSTRFHEMINEMAARNRTLKVVFFAIGEEVSCPAADPDGGLLVYRTDSEGIISTMAEMSDVISARQRVPETTLAQDGDVLSFTAPLPMRSLTVYTQGSSEPLLSAAGPDGRALKLSTVSGISAPDAFTLTNGIRLVTDESLKGSVTHITSEEGVLPPGKYTLTFSGDAGALNCRALYEPALSIRLRYLIDGEETPLPQNGQFADIEALLVDDAGVPFDPDLLQTPVECRLQEIRDGTVVRTVEGFVLDNVRLVDGRVSVVWEAAVKGYFTVRGRMNYEAPAAGATAVPTAVPAETPAAQSPALSLVVGGTLPGQSVPLGKLEEATLLVSPRYGGEPLTEEQAGGGVFSAECLYSVAFDVAYDAETQTYSVSPRYYGGNSLITAVGPVQLLVQYTLADGTTVTQTVHFTIVDIPPYVRYGKQLLIPFVLIFLAVLLSGILFARRKFPRENAWLEYRQLVRGSKGQWALSLPPSRIDLKPQGPWTLVPFSPERINAAGLIVKAGRSPQSVMVDKKCLKPGVSGGGGPLSGAALRRDYELQSGAEFVVEQGDVRQVYKLVAPKVTLIGKAQERKRKQQKSKFGIIVRSK